MTKGYVADIIERRHLRIEMQAVAVCAISHAESLQTQVGGRYRRAYLLRSDTQSLRLLRIRLNDDLRLRVAADIDHGSLWQLLHAFTHHPRHVVRQSCETLLTVVIRIYVDIERRDIRSPRLHHLRTLHPLRKHTHRTVNLLIRLYK